MAELLTIQPYKLVNRNSGTWANFERMYDEDETTYCNNASSSGITLGIDLGQIPRNHVITNITARVLYKRKGNTTDKPRIRFATWVNNANVFTSWDKYLSVGSYNTKEWVTASAAVNENTSATLMNAAEPCIVFNSNFSEKSPVYEIYLDITHEESDTSKIYIGENKVSAVYVGTTKASAVYVGTTKVL